jgi:RimJ/RimL family protein N-acetyltransferase
MPLLERAWAQRAGIGFIGKNSCLIVPGLGSHVMLATIVTSAELPPDAPMRERCGECRLCLDGCPTRAFVGPRDLDARRCISYLTIEHRGEIDPELQPAMGDWLFGCDACQDVCPYNRVPEREPCMPGLDAERSWHALTAGQLLQLNDAELLALTEGSPLRRPGPEGLRRNATIALANTRARRGLPVVQGPFTVEAPDTRPRITTQRLRGEPVELRHAAAMARVLSDPRIWLHLDQEPPTLAALLGQYAFLSAGKSPDGTEHWLTWILFAREADAGADAGAARVDRSEPEPLGFVQATIKEPATAHLAYVLHPSHWRRGYAREAIGALLDLVFARYRVARAVIEMDTRNSASIALARALGFRHVATTETASGHEHGYELTRSDALAPRIAWPRPPRS